MPSNAPKALPADERQGPWLVYLAFFASGISGLIYQVVWVRAFGNVFGNTVHSAAIVVAVFILGLGAGSHLVGAWADERYSREPGSLLRTYGKFEIVIAMLGFAVSIALPRLGPISAFVSFYVPDASGWYVPSVMTYIARVAISVVLLLPITMLMGGTLTLLIRHLVRQDVSVAPIWIARLYAVNTVGAALGSLLTDFALVPAVGLLRTQLVAVALNVMAGVAALAVASRPNRRTVVRQSKRDSAPPRLDALPQRSSAVVLASLALGLAGFAGLGVEIVWFRHATILLGGFRTVFALLLTVVLTGIAVGAWAGGILARRTSRAAECLMLTQTLFVVSTVTTMLFADAHRLETTARAATVAVPRFTEIWFNVAPLIELAFVPSILMGLGFPLANALVQQSEHLVARRAGVLYLANTIGAVCGSIAAGFVLLPWLGIQVTTAVLSGASALSLVPLYLLSQSGRIAIAAVPLLTAAAAIAACFVVPPDFVIRRAVGSAAETQQLLTQHEGLTEVVTITESRDSRLLLTNGHAMSSTAPLSQRYMRALAHVPLLMMEDPASVLVIGFGVGNTTHAATLHPSVRRVEVADLSRSILEYASYFDDANQGVLTDPRVTVFVNDGRQHLQTRADGAYDLITLEPPPISYAGAAALYSREFYQLARSRLSPRGFVSQWLPTYQVPTATALSMIRAFVDVFPRAVLLSGAQADLLLVGTARATIELEPERVAAALTRRPRVRDDLQRLDLGSVREIAGSFVGSARTLEAATSGVRPVTDDWPVMEHSVISALNPGQDVPAAVVDLARLPDWCPRCFADGGPVQAVAGLDLYMRLIELAYRASPSEGAHVAASQSAVTPRRVAGSAYLGTIVPEGAELYNTIGVYSASHGALRDAIEAFRTAVQLDPESALSHWHLGAALAESGAREEATAHLQRSVDLDPTNKFARDDLNAVLAAREIR